VVTSPDLNQDIIGTKHYRIIPSRYPPIQIFEDLVDPDELEILCEIEGLTNERIREEVGQIALVKPEDRVTGSGSTPVMAAFTHIGFPSRFTDGRYGIYYAGLRLKTAQEESKFHRERFLLDTAEPSCNLEMRCYIGKISLPLHDIRNKEFIQYHSPDLNSYPLCQAFAAQLRESNSAGIYYNSVRDSEGECIALFKPISSTTVQQSTHFIYHFNGKEIDTISKVEQI